MFTILSAFIAPKGFIRGEPQIFAVRLFVRASVRPSLLDMFLFLDLLPSKQYCKLGGPKISKKRTSPVLVTENYKIDLKEAKAGQKVVLLVREYFGDDVSHVTR